MKDFLIVMAALGSSLIYHPNIASAWGPYIGPDTMNAKTPRGFCRDIMRRDKFLTEWQLFEFIPAYQMIGYPGWPEISRDSCGP